MSVIAAPNGRSNLQMQTQPGEAAEPASNPPSMSNSEPVM
jgi:hypothetical protein